MYKNLLQLLISCHKNIELKNIGKNVSNYHKLCKFCITVNRNI